MSLTDARGLELSGASPSALEHFERALAAHLRGHGDVARPLALALVDAPGFAMAWLFSAYQVLGGREPAGVARAATILVRLAGMRLNARERAHAAAVAAMADGEFDRAGALHGAILAEYPRDVLALQVAHSCDYIRGDARSLKRRAAAVIPAWSEALPGYHAVLTMRAFALEEAGAYCRAEEYVRRALALEPGDARAHHTMAHVHEMLGRARDGIRWAGERAPLWAGDDPLAVHNWWHVALFNLRLGRTAQALAIYDRRIRPRLDGALSVAIDASALLWRVRLGGGEPGDRWHALADRWMPHAEDAYCAFNDVHAMMAFVAAGRRERANALVAAQRGRAALGGTNGAMTRFIGLPACLALRDFGEGRHGEAAARLRGLPPIAHRLGGSRAQHGIIADTLDAALRADRRLALAA